MNFIKLVPLSLALALTSVFAEASQEHVLQLTKFHLESTSQTDRGTVLVHGSQDQAGKFHELKVEFLGRTIKVPRGILQQIPANANGVIISSASGYESLGGRQIYITFLVTWANAREIYKRFVIAVGEDGRSKVANY